MDRVFLGLSVGSGLLAVDAAVVRVGGLGLAMTASPAAAVRRPLAADLRGPGRRPADADAQLAEAAVQAGRQAAGQAGVDLRRVAAVGLLGPVSGVAERVADGTGLTAVADLPGRDAAAGGSGRLVTAAADFLLYRAAGEDRLLVHLGAVTSVLLVPAGGRVSEVSGCEAGPGGRLLDDLTALGTRGRDATDAGGTKAVQGRRLDPLLARWAAHPYLAQRPPKAVPPGLFGGPFAADAFAAARGLGGTLHDLLCTATHFVAGCVGDAARRWLPAARPGVPRRVLVSGGGVRNGFLWQLVEGQFAGTPVDRLDAVGVPAAGRAAAAAAVLAALTADGVAGNLPLLTGAAGSRLLGRVVPGEFRHWATAADWMARRLADYPPAGRAA